MEQWKPLNCGNYEVSSHGRVRRKTKGMGTEPGRLKKLSQNGMGYLVTSITANQETRPHYVHQLVARAFLGECPSGKEINHKDGDKLNNMIDNLEYVSHRENMIHAGRMGVMDRGTIEQKTKDIIVRMRSSGHTYKEISATTGVSRSHCGWIYRKRSGQSCQ